MRNADFSGANLAGACFDDGILDGAHLERATLVGTTFSRVRVGTLLSCGIRPRDLLAQRAGADPRCFPRLLFGPDTAGCRFAVTGREAARICTTVSDLSWDALTTVPALGGLYPERGWTEWILRCRSRRVLDWALAHSSFLETLPAHPFPHYGRVLPSSLLDEVRDEDLAAGGLATNPERLFTAIGTRRAEAPVGSKETDNTYPPDLFDDVAGVVRIASTAALNGEAALMGHCVDMYDDDCRAGEAFIYHVGAPAPRGSTLQVAPDGETVQHYARFNAPPEPEDIALVEAWRAYQLLPRAQRHGVAARIPAVEPPAAPAALPQAATALTWHYLAEAGVAIIRCQVRLRDGGQELHVLDIDGAPGLPPRLSASDLQGLIEHDGYGDGRFELRVDRRQVRRLGPRLPAVPGG